ncbi:aldehyde:ferredoxin oxidoreductase [Longilinea arvoryzae]|uniref:Aldehyde:ferredoxin oxidoreductase n=1 Tax=Longilinea arvoryzae TaxID=360412 RepID=A0A0S7BE41_9CHLR|nr:aldehyde ferredoxin oxidoreductase family protein [Longilinea arvoryzae]GAP13108.1 aldehyde:ferredoxin oxidoreductase [Longilinea arvoryzae]
MNGYAGKLLFVDLSKGTLQDEPLTDEMARNFIGGYGLGARILYSRMKPGADALGPDSMLGFVTGPVTGTEANFSGRYTVVCKSPVSGTWNDSNSGGYFGPELKKAGYDGVFITGISPSPVYLWIHEGTAELRDAANLWGLDAKETQTALETETGEPKLRAAVIGPAGERLSLISCVINDGHRAAGRGGLGAVMGSKRLKAVAARGTGRIEVADPERAREINLAIRAALKADPYAGYFRSGGTGAGTPDSVFNGDSPVKNWGQAGVDVFAPQQTESLSGIKISEKYLVKHYACAHCPLGCGAELTVDDGRYPLQSTERPEYETLAAFGPLCGNTQVEAIIQCNELCNRAGLDTISAGATIAWAIECFENGVIGREETGGLELVWGNADAIVEVTREMADGRGFGAVLGLGSQGAANKLEKGHEYLQTVRGIELPMHDPRLYPGLARTYQFDPTPGRHVKGGIGLTQGYLGPEKYQTQGSGPADVQATTFNEMLSSGGFCLFISYFGGSDQVLPMVTAVTGFDLPTLESAAIRILTMRQAFNQREGLTRADFKLPARSVGQPPLAAGPSAGGVVDSEALGDNFFAELGWDVKTGKPSREALMKLGGMEDVIRDLY